MAVLGDLEQQTMAVLWRSELPLSVRDVLDELNRDRSLAYTTVMTVLDRLSKKGVVARELEGRAWLYRPLKSCVDLHVEQIVSLLHGCGEGHSVEILTRVIDATDDVVVHGRVSCHRRGDPAWSPDSSPTPYIREVDDADLIARVLDRGLRVTPVDFSSNCSDCSASGCASLRRTAES